MSFLSRKKARRGGNYRGSTEYPCKTRKGMSVALDSAWQKQGFDSLTCKLIVTNTLFQAINIHLILLKHIGIYMSF